MKRKFRQRLQIGMMPKATKEVGGAWNGLEITMKLPPDGYTMKTWSGCIDRRANSPPFGFGIPSLDGFGQVRMYFPSST